MPTRSAGGLLSAVFLLSAFSFGQSTYKTITVSNGGTIEGTVKWVGPVPKIPKLPINKDAQICDPDSTKTRDLERLIIGSNHGVENTVVYLVNINEGKAMDLPEARRTLDQRHCRYIPHILLVPQDGKLKMKSSDPTLHTIHMTGAATYNLPFPFQSDYISRQMVEKGVVEMKCNAGHVWMNGYTIVAPHPYYAITDEDGHYKLTDVPPGTYRIEAWHEGWGTPKSENVFDVATQVAVHRPVYTPPRTWGKSVTVGANAVSTVDFELSEAAPNGMSAAK